MSTSQGPLNWGAIADTYVRLHGGPFNGHIDRVRATPLPEYLTCGRCPNPRCEALHVMPVDADEPFDGPVYRLRETGSTDDGRRVAVYGWIDSDAPEALTAAAALGPLVA